MKKLLVYLSVVSAILTSLSATGQDLATKKIIAKYEKDYIPEFKSSLAYRSGNPALGKINVVIDFKSFGNNAEELDLAVRELNMVKGAILFLAKDAAGKTAIEKGLNTITIRQAADAAGRQLKLTNGNLILATHSFDLKTLIGTPEIQKYLEKSL